MNGVRESLINRCYVCGSVIRGSWYHGTGVICISCSKLTRDERMRVRLSRFQQTVENRGA